MAPCRCRTFLHVKAQSCPRPGLSLSIPNGRQGAGAASSLRFHSGFPELFKRVHFDPVFGEAAAPTLAQRAALGLGSPSPAGSCRGYRPPSTVLSNAGISVVINRHSRESLIVGFQLLKEPLFVLVLVFLLTNQTASGPSSSVALDGGDGRWQRRRRKGRPDSDSSRAGGHRQGEPSPEAPWLQRPMAGSPGVCVFSFFVLLLKPQFSSLQNGQTIILASVSPRFSRRGSLHFDNAGVSGNSGSPTLLPQVSF